MSKIYEAMRRAELDAANRAAAEPAPPAQPARQIPAATPIPAAPIPAAPIHNTSISVAPIPSAPILIAPIPVAAATVPAAPIPAAPVAAVPIPAAAPTGIASAPAANAPMANSALDLANIRQVTWNPSLHQLPALEQRGAAVEQFRSLRSRMQAFRDLNTLKSILISSALPQEGKSFVAINLAITFARHKGRRVLLIDGDMRRATLHNLLGAPMGPGLTEYLAGKATLTDVMQRPKPSEAGTPLPPGLASLVFIPGGLASDKAGDLSGNQRFGRLIVEAAPHFHWIVVDSSPVNLVSDGVNLARACDGVLLVARGGRTKFEAAQRALAELKASTVLGFVLNAVENLPASGSYYGYDQYDKIEE